MSVPAAERVPCFGEPFVLQWHLGDRCNLACKHCYREGPVRPSMSAPLRGRVIDELAAFCDRRGLGARLHLAGGEPTLEPDLVPIVRAARARGIRSRLLTNGTRITEALARELCELDCLGVQISIEGGRELHDELRGRGSFDAALAGAKTLREAGVFVTLGMTLHERNVGELDTVAALAAAHADRVYFSRLVPIGRGAELGGALPARRWHRVMERILRLERSAVAVRDPTFRPLLAAAHHARRSTALAGCSAGYNTLTLEADGTFMPCRRLDVGLGRFGEVSFEEVWTTSPVLARLRDRDALGGACGRCAYRWVCGGCRAVARAVTGDLGAADPGCPWGTSLGSRVGISARHALKEGRARIRVALGGLP